MTFFLSRVAPGDPARLIAGPHANAAAVAHIRAIYGLDRPLVAQYVHYMADLLHGNFGRSFVTRRSVGADLLAFLPATIELSVYALVLGSVLGVVIAVLAATRRGSAVDGGARLFAIAGLSMPSFWLALIFQLVFCSTLHWCPFGGRLATGGLPPPPI